MPEDNDFIGKRVNDAGKIFGMADKNALALMLAVSLIFNFILFGLYSSAKNETVEINNKWSKMIIEEVRKQVPGAVKQEVKEQVKPIAESVDTAKNNIDRFIERVSK